MNGTSIAVSATLPNPNASGGHAQSSGVLADVNAAGAVSAPPPNGGMHLSAPDAAVAGGTVLGPIQTGTTADGPAAPGIVCGDPTPLAGGGTSLAGSPDPLAPDHRPAVFGIA